VLRGFFDFLAKMGLSVRDDPPKVVDLTVREWGPEQAGLALSIAEIPREDADALPRVSVVIRNVSRDRKTFSVPGWLFFYGVEVRMEDGTLASMSPFGRQLLKPERRTEQLEVSLEPGEFREAEIPIGSIFGLRARGRYTVSLACEPSDGVVLASNAIVIR
jgi:hypothetical protein